MSNRRKSFLIWGATIFLALILLPALTLFSYQKAYAGKIYKNVHFADVDLSGRTKTQAQYLVQSKLRGFTGKDLALSANGKEVKVKLEDTGISFDPAKIIESSYSIGRNNSFISNLTTSTKTIFNDQKISATPYLDQTKYNQFLQIAIGQLNIAPEDAAISIDNGNVKLNNSSNGSNVITDNLADEIISLSGNASDSKIELATLDVPPKVKNADFQTATDEANALLSKKITFAYTDKSYSPSRVAIGAWIEFYSDQNVYHARLNDSNVKAYFNLIAKNFEVTKKDTRVDASGAVLSAGVQGVYLNKDKTLADLKAGLPSPVITIAMTVTTTDPGTVTVLPDNGNAVAGRFPGKYIDVDLKTQTLCRFDGATAIDCFPVSTGKPSTPTPTGTFSIFLKDPKSWSHASSLWMPWYEEWGDGGYGIHELPVWPNGYQEGADHLGTPVSHGCIRLGVGPAETVYNWTDIGTPVFIHN